MKKLFQLLIIFAIIVVYSVPNKVSASHVVGGEITITHIQAFEYAITLSVYRDATNGIGLPPTADITAVQRSNINNQAGNFALQRISDSLQVPDPAGCAGNIIDIERHVYTDTVTLSPTVFNHPSGYIFSWSTCCRNGAIDNIQAPGSTGNRTATLFSPVVDASGNQIINSTPQIFPPAPDYGCQSVPYFQDFSGVDFEGDSLSYVLYTPFDDNAVTSGVVSPLSAPWPDPSTMFTNIVWSADYNIDNQVNGFSTFNGTVTNGAILNEPDRLIVGANSGFINFVPDQPGLYLFGIWVREYRDVDPSSPGKELIGSVFRDFQLQIDPPCNVNPPPPPPLPTAGGTINDTIVVPGIIGQRCVQYKFFDPDAQNSIPGPGTRFRISVLSSSLPDSVVNITPDDLNLTSATDTVLVDLCFGDCAFSQAGEVLDLSLLVEKDNCPQIRKDTFQLSIIVQPLPNPDAFLDTVDINYPLALSNFSNVDSIIEFQIRPNWTIEFDLLATDSIYDSLYQYVSVPGLATEELGIDSAKSLGVEFYNDTDSTLLKGLGQLASTFKWKPDCTLFGTGQAEFNLVTVDRYCGENTTVRKIRFVILENNESPLVVAAPGEDENATETQITGEDINGITTYTFTKRVGTTRALPGSPRKEGEGLIFDIEGSDPDLDEVILNYYVKDNGVFLDKVGSQEKFDDISLFYGRTNSRIGDTTLSSTVTWESQYITCEALNPDGQGGYIPLEFMVVATDSSCFAANDTAIVVVNLDNGTKPELSIFQDQDGETIELTKGEDGNVSIDFSAEDLSFFVTGFDNDQVTILNGPDPAETEFDRVKLGVSLPDLDINETIDEFEIKGIEAYQVFVQDEPQLRNPMRYVDRQDTIFFYWNPECDARNAALPPLVFQVNDNACSEDGIENIADPGLKSIMEVTINPVGQFEPINVITANNDGYNDKLELYAVQNAADPNTRKVVVEPLQCGFETVKVYNRYGRLVFESEEKDFSWDAENVPYGDYFYEMKFGDRTIRSYLKVMK